ncbi:LysR family transcriptional regulator [Chondrinema litorale]|uniref:LysR family transcriptional regulator n=1 Tax=Chondrinema litorale TaxID=2994555 RepID=UPI00254281C2|nr:LysR family transcriptional regulator [Chondrinema litorale]UZR98341.1 LysR family transcriptional regulator [Chondrinema litorale]
MFDFRLQVFHTVAKRLNFTKAAKELYISQPAVTKHIHEIENHFQMKLFDRNGTKIKLTLAGETLLQYTEQLFALYRSLEIDMNALSSKKAGKLRIGASTTVAQYVLPPVMAAFHEKFKDISINLLTGNTEQIEKALQKKEIDLGIIEGYSKTAAIKYSKFIKDEVVLVSNVNNPLAKKQRISIAEFKKTPLLIREHGSGTLDVIAHSLKQKSINLSELNIEMELSSTESIKLYLLNSNCVSLLSVHSVLKELKNNECCIIDIKGLSIERYFYFIQTQGKADSLSELFMKYASRYNFRL